MESLESRLTQPDGLAARLRAMRVQAGLSGKQLADAHGWAQSKVSRIERGQQLPSSADLEAWAVSCGARPGMIAELMRMRDEARVWRAAFRDTMRNGQEAVQEDYNDLVRESSLIRHFETAYVPGLLQVPAYARRVLAEMVTLHELAIDDVDQAVSARMARQQMLYDPGKRFEFLLAEPVLRWLLVPPAAMRSQLDRLQTVIGLERVRFGVLPMGVPLATTPQSSFQIYAGARTVAVAETFLGERFHAGGEAEDYGRALDLMWGDAAEGEPARELLINATRSLPDD